MLPASLLGPLGRKCVLTHRQTRTCPSSGARSPPTGNAQMGSEAHRHMHTPTDMHAGTRAQAGRHTDPLIHKQGPRATDTGARTHAHTKAGGQTDPPHKQAQTHRRGHTQACTDVYACTRTRSKAQTHTAEMPQYPTLTGGLRLTSTANWCPGIGNQKVPVLGQEIQATITLPPRSSQAPSPLPGGALPPAPQGNPETQASEVLPPCHPPGLDPSDPGAQPTAISLSPHKSPPRRSSVG